VANEVDASVLMPMHASSAGSLLDCASSQPNLVKLPSADHPVLPLRDLSQPAVIIASPRKCISKMTFGGLGGHPPTVARNIARVVRGLCRLSFGRRA
jgi:hypothetical protein